MSLPVTTKEIKDILYRPESGNKEWPSGSRDLICDRILKGLHDLMGMSLAEPFLAPVDIQEYPSYAYIVEYPIDLSIIKVIQFINIGLGNKYFNFIFSFRRD